LVLLVLLWGWAALMFVVVDLFLNVEEFDAIRPRARLYQTMRSVAHDMVGEKIDTTVVGRVLDPKGEPVRRAAVLLARGVLLIPGPVSTTADDAGNFELRLGVAPAWDGLVVTAPGHAPARVHISEGFQRLTVVLQRLPVIRGRVSLTEGGTPPEFEVLVAAVTSAAADHPPGPFGARIDDDQGVRLFRGERGDGEFLFEDLDPTGYSVIVRAPGRAVVRLTGVLPEPRDNARPIDIALPPSSPPSR
jgi:hypothetical protein